MRFRLACNSIGNCVFAKQILKNVPYILRNLDKINLGLGDIVDFVAEIPVGLLPVEAQEQLCAAVQPVCNRFVLHWIFSHPVPFLISS